MTKRCCICKKELMGENKYLMQTFSGTLGYGSKYDMADFKLYFCPQCLDKLVEQDAAEE